MNDYLLPEPLDPRRKDTVGASEVASLFSSLWSDPEKRPDDVPPYHTRFRLWHLKHGTLPAEPEDQDDLDDDDVRQVGKFMEPAIGAIATALRGWKVEPAGFVLHHSLPRMSATPDFVAMSGAKPFVLPSGLELATGADMEAKNVGEWAYRRWPERVEEGVWLWRQGGWRPAERQVPFIWKLQAQHQMACTGRLAHVTVPFVGGNKPRFYLTLRNEGVIGRLEREVEAFWASIEAGKEPDPEWELDAATVVAMHQYAAEGKVLDLRGVAAADELAAEYYRHQQAEAAAKAAKKVAKAKLLIEAGDAARIFTDRFKVSAGEVKDAFVRATDVNDKGEPGTWRSGYRNVRVSPAKES